MPAEPGPDDRGRHVAVIVEALLATRPAVATDRFDAEIADAVANGRLDPATARALRYRQRASVRAVETYLVETLGAILETQRAAARQAVADVEDDDLAWATARALVAEPAADDLAPVEAVRLAAVPDLEQPSRLRTADETKAAIRAALQS